MDSKLIPLVLILATSACALPEQSAVVEDGAGPAEAGDGKSDAWYQGSPDGGLFGDQFDPCSMTSTRTNALEVFAQPDVAEGPFLDAIEAAQDSIRVMVYQFTSPTIREAIRAKAAAGLDVRLVLDQKQQSTNEKTYDVLTAAGAKIEWSNPEFTYTHAKFLVIDDELAIISTGNLDTFMDHGRNFAATDRDADDVQTLIDIFDADFTHSEPNITCTRLVVSPINARARHLELLRSAKKTLEIESMQFADWDIRNEVLERQAAGVDIRVLLAAPSWISANRWAGEWLVDHGIEARWRSSPSVHVKAFVIDGKVAFLGSENLSKTSLSKNREVGLVSTETDDVELVRDTFETDWNTATEF